MKNVGRSGEGTHGLAGPARIVKVPGEPTTVDSDVEHNVTIHEFQGNWHGVTYKGWQVSVSPDALIRLPAHLKPDEVEDFVAAVRAAAPVAAKVKADNDAASAQNHLASNPAAFFTQGGLPPGATRMPMLPRTDPDKPSRPMFTPERLANARQIRAAGAEKAGQQGTPPTRPRVPLPPAPRSNRTK